MKNSIKSTILFSAILLGTASCTSEFEKFNTNQYDATKDEMQYDAYNLGAAMIGMQGYVVPTSNNLYQFTDCLLGGSYGGYLSDSNKGFVGKNFATYTPAQSWNRVPFNDVIPKIYSNQIMIKNATEDPIILAVADIIKVAAIHRITDTYGGIPYTQIGVDGKLEAPYDTQEEVYNAFFSQLDAAIEVLSNNPTADFNAKADNVYNGNVMSWIKFANSLKLRLAMRCAYANPTLAQQKAEEAASHAIGTMTANADNAWNAVNYSPLRTVTYDYNGGDSRISADITTYMNGFNDPRREQYFTESTFTAEEAADGNGYYGLRNGSNFSSSANAHKYSNVNMSQLDGHMLWMNAAESAFLKAEGALRGWNMGGTAQAYYEEGVRLSFGQWGATGVDAYLEDATNTPAQYNDPLGENSYTGSMSAITIQWDETAEFETNLERIITQKWIANFPLGAEGWAEFRRTGYPNLMAVPHNLSGGIVDDEAMARRLAYPQTEYQENNANVQAAVQALGGPDNMATNVWWDKKPKN